MKRLRRENLLRLRKRKFVHCNELSIPQHKKATEAAFDEIFAG
jgi:hypothetical protein